MTALVSITHLSKTFPGVRALHDCQFELLAGEVHALMGMQLATQRESMAA